MFDWITDERVTVLGLTLFLGALLAVCWFFFNGNLT